MPVIRPGKPQQKHRLKNEETIAQTKRLGTF
jgi:hypothetical protein